MILMLTRPVCDFRWLRTNMRAWVLRDVDESASLLFLYCYLREQRLRWLSYSLHRLILYIFTYIINKVSWQIYPGIQADTCTNSSITVFVLALVFLTDEKMWIERTSEWIQSDGKCKDIPELFPGYQWPWCERKRYTQRMRASSDAMSSSTPETARRNAQMIVGVASTELFHATSVGAACHF